MAKRKYFILVVRDYDGQASYWSQQFGDYSRKVVKQEVEDTYRRDYKAKDIKVIQTLDDQASINAVVAQLNSKG